MKPSDLTPLIYLATLLVIAAAPWLIYSKLERICTEAVRATITNIY